VDTLGKRGARALAASLSLGLGWTTACALGGLNGLSTTSGPEAGTPPPSSSASAAPSGTSSGVAPSDSGLPVDAGCGHLLCEDFDDENPLSRWTTTISPATPPQPSLGVDSVAATTGTRSFFAQVDPDQWADVADIMHVFDVGPTATFQCSFDFRLDKAPTDGENQIASLIPAGIADNFELNVYLDKSGNGTHLSYAYPDDAGVDVPDSDGPLLPVGQWTTLTLTLTRRPAPLATLSDGVTTGSIALSGWPATSKLALQLGLTFGNPYDSSDVSMLFRYDRIRCDAR
jgi:hypothetical protein